MTAHVFGEQAVAELVEAGIDGIEHGTGIDADVIALMAERQVALVPTMLQLDNFERYAEQGEARFPRYAAHMRALYARRLDTFGAAHDAGRARSTPARTRVATCRTGWWRRRSPRWPRSWASEGALAAGSWAARRWLGRADALVDGAPADLSSSTPTRAAIWRCCGRRDS